MDFIETVILGVIQGIAEFLPISSSAHLIIFRDLFGIGSSVITGDLALAFDIALHFGTLLAIAIYFFNDFLSMVIKGVTTGTKTQEGKMFWHIVVATIPAAIVGILFEDVIETAVRGNFILIGSALIIMGIIIYLADKFSKQTKSFQMMGFKDAIIIGCSQVFALIPGFSRSGTTIAAARSLQLDREEASKFSFYLSAPVVCGAVVLSIFDSTTMTAITENISIFVVGVLVAFFFGLLCIEFLLKYIKKHDFKIFMWYRILIGVVVIAYTLMR